MTVDRRRDAVVATLAVVVAAGPVIVAAVRAAAGPWVPVSDAAYFTTRSLDVGTEHHPLLGAWSSGSTGLSRSVNNLGPLQLDLLAPFTRVAPWGGTAIGVGAVHVASILVIAWLVRRIGGDRLVLPAMAAVSLLAWQLGSLMLITPNQHQYLVLPYLAFLVAAWAVATGDRWAIVPVVALGSLCTQTHLSYPVLVGLAAVPMVVGLVVARRSHPTSGDVRPFVVSAALAAVLWAQPAIDQIAGSGNLLGVLSSSGEGSGDGPSPTTALRIVSGVVLSPRGYLRPGWARYVTIEAFGGDGATLALVALVVGLVVGSVVAWRRARPRAGAGLAVAATALVAAVVDPWVLPPSPVFGLLPNNYRSLWSLTALLVLGAGCLATRLARAGRAAATTAVAALLGTALAVTSVANLPASSQVNQLADARDQASATEAVIAALDDVDFEGPVLIDDSQLYFGQPYTFPTLAWMTSRGIEWRFDDELQFRRFGDGRRADGTERQRLVMYYADDAVARRDAPETVVYVDARQPISFTLLELDP